MVQIKVYLTQEIRDANGKRIFYKKRASHSFVLQFLEMLSVWMNHAYDTDSAAQNVTDTGGAARSLIAGAAFPGDRIFAGESPAGTTTYGIQYGTGTNAESGTDTSLQTQIAEGAGAGQLNHGSTAITVATSAGGITSFTIVRAGANNSGGVITIEEVGVIVASQDNAATQRNFLWLRDLTGGVAINNGQTYTCTYTIQTSV